MGEREVRRSQTRREEISDWLEEMAGQIRAGTLMVDGDSVSLPEETRARLKSKSKDGRRRLRLDLEWPEERPAGSQGGKKKKKGKDKPPAERGNGGAPPVGAESSQMGRSNRDRAGREGQSRESLSVVSGEMEHGAGERGSVRDYDSHVLVCKGGDCSKKGGKETKKALKSGLRAEGLNRDVRVDSVECLGLCKQGPNVIIYPEGSWYLGLKEGDVPEVVEEHLKHGEPVERLAAARKPRKQTK